MALVNIGEGNRDDGFYRYKMPRMITKIEGRGNGIKTNLVNMVDVAKALARPPAYTTKYFGCVLGAQSKFDEKTATSTVNGAHDNAKLTQLLEGFIKKYVQCYGCGNPETEVVITKTQMIILKCAACGFLSDVDMRDKLTTFILNNPPETKKSKGKGLRKAEKERLKAGEAMDEEAKSKKSSKKKGEESAKKSKKKDDEEKAASPDNSQKDDEEAADDEDDDVEWLTDTSAEAAKKRIEEQLTAASSEMVMLAVEEEKRNGKSSKDKSLQKTSSKGSEKDCEEGLLSPAVNGFGKVKAAAADSALTKADGNEDEEEVEEESEHEKLVNDLMDYIKTHTLAETAAHVKSRGELTQDLLTALFEALFHGIGKGLSKEVTKKKVLLRKILADEVAQKQLLVAMERYCGVVKPDAIKEVPLVLKALYDNDIVEEEQINEWFDRKQSEGSDVTAEVAAAVRKEANPFVQWLREAEAESEEE